MKFKGIKIEEIGLEISEYKEEINGEEAYDYFYEILKNKLNGNAYLDDVTDSAIQIRFERDANKETIKRYRLGYDYLFLPKKPFMYKGDLISSTTITVLFKVYDIEGNEVLFESKTDELNEQKLKLRNGEEYYLCDLFYCSFDKEKFKDNQTFDFIPTMNVIMSNYSITMDIHCYTKDLEKINAISEPVKIEKIEFDDIMLNNLKLFDVVANKPAQSISYIVEEVKNEK